MRKTEITEEIIGYLKEGKSEREIGELLGYTKDKINWYIKKHGLSKYRSPRYIDWGKEKEKLRKLLEKDGLSQREIGEIFGVSSTTIRNIARKFGLITYKNPKSYSVSNRIKKLSIPSKEELITILENNNWNYSKTGRELGVSDNAIRILSKKFGVYQPKLKNWSEIIDIESAQRKVDELGVKTSKELYYNYGGLADKLKTLGFISHIKFPGNGFDSSWEERMFNLVKDNIVYTSLEHNIILSPECKYKRPLVFDIVIEYPDSSMAVIEIQGPTHFNTVFGKSDSSNIVRERDEIKYQYCISNNIDIYYFTYEPKLLKDYGYPYYVYTDENLLLEKLKK